MVGPPAGLVDEFRRSLRPSKHRIHLKLRQNSGSPHVVACVLGYMRVALVRVFLERSTNHLVARRLPLETPRGGRRSGKEGGIMTVSGQGLRVAFTAALICLVAQARAADTQKLAASCEAAKNQVAGRYTFCRHRAKAKEVKKGSPADFAKCE